MLIKRLRLYFVNTNTVNKFKRLIKITATAITVPFAGNKNAKFFMHSVTITTEANKRLADIIFSFISYLQKKQVYKSITVK